MAEIQSSCLYRSCQPDHKTVQNESIPYSIEAERAVLSGLMYDNLSYEQVSDFLRQEHFYDPLHQKIYQAIAHCIQNGGLANSITIEPFLAQDLQAKGTVEYLKTLSRSVMSVSYVGEYGRQILDAFLRRELIRIGSDLVNKASQFEVGETYSAALEETEQRLFKLSTQYQSERGVKTFSNLLKDVISLSQVAMRSDSHTVGIPTGLIDLDRHLGGLHRSDLIILAGRPSMGKTALATNIAFNAAQLGKSGVAFFSLEMSAEQLAMRILGQEAEVSPDKIRKGIVSQNEVTMLLNQAKKLASAPFYIDDTPALTIAGLRTRARRLHRQEGISLIVVDYLQLLSSGLPNENRVQELSSITRSLKAIAKELNVPVLALSQLSRAVEQRDDKRPQLSDLRESGSIEQDADVVMFVFREAYYESRKKPSEGSPKMQAWQEKMSKIHNIAELMIAKQRHGPIKNITLHFQEMFTKFGNYMGEGFVEE